MPASSALSPHPFLLAKAVRIASLRRRRRVWAFLPPSYAREPRRRYPVVYFHDGQNVFEGWKAAFGQGWQAHDTLKALAGAHPESILVGVEHGKRYRKGEYLPFDRNGGFSAEGNAYADFMANELKSLVDKKLRTLPGREHTAIVGSSLGGLSALFTGFKHQDVFSAVGAFSPSLWAGGPLFPLVAQVGAHFPMKYYLCAGGREPKSTGTLVLRMAEALRGAGFPQVQARIVPGAQHHEPFWREEFPHFYRWLHPS
jgi:enterochelin esterase-like enzyme